MRSDKENLIVEMTFDFALKIIKCSKELQKSKDYSLADQLLRAGISIGANVRETQNAESKADFIHKMKIAAKEADEVEYYLLLIQKSEHYILSGLPLDEIKSITRIISSSQSA
jgi:four helix bundle protein